MARSVVSQPTLSKLLSVGRSSRFRSVLSRLGQCFQRAQPYKAASNVKSRRRTVVQRRMSLSLSTCFIQLYLWWLYCREQPGTVSAFNFQQLDTLLKLRRDTGYIFHVTKESQPLAVFGGVGEIVGDLSRLQATRSNVTVFVILPKYGFIRDVSLVSSFQFKVGTHKVHGTLYATVIENVQFLLIGTSNLHPRLWRSKLMEDMYNCPYGVSPGERDLYFSFVSSQVITTLVSNDTTARANQFRKVVHVHSATNAAVLWFLQNMRTRKNMRLVYTMHDYNNEPYKVFSVKHVKSYIPPALELSVCAGNQFDGTPTDNHGQVSAMHFVMCADSLSTVSTGMIRDLQQAHLSTSLVITKYLYEGRLFPISNWVSVRIWKEARELVHRYRPNNGKEISKQVLFDNFRTYGVGPKPVHGSVRCLIGWNGRFDENKGFGLLAMLHAVICEEGCMFSIAGYITSKRSHQRVQSQLRTMRAHAFKNTCPFYFFGSLQQQHSMSYHIRAAADIDVITSRNEAFGLVAAEAFAFGTIPVVSSVGGLPELIVPYSHRNAENWTGLYFGMASASETTKSVKHALAQAVGLLESARKSGSISSLQRRLIASAPLLERGGHFEVAYEALYNN